MKTKKLFLTSILLLLFSTVSIAQKELSDSETQNFFRLIKQTNEYNVLHAKADSINKKQPNKAPQEIDIHIVKKTNGDSEDHIFHAVLERTIIGMALEGYYFSYDKQKKQIISIQKQQSHLQIN